MDCVNGAYFHGVGDVGGFDLFIYGVIGMCGECAGVL